MTSRFGIRNVSEWVSLLAGFIIGLLSLFIAQWIDALLANGAFPNPALYIIEYLIAGVAVALCSSHLFRSFLIQGNALAAIALRAMIANTVAFAPFLAITLWLSPDISARWLLYYYALSILFDWIINCAVRSDEFIRSRATPTNKFVTTFIVAALFLLVLTPVYTAAGQQTAAQRMANWAYGFLVLGVGEGILALGRIPERINGWNRYLVPALVGILSVAFFVGGYYLGNGTNDSAEKTYIVNTDPQYVADRIRGGDVIVSDSPNLRLGSIPKITAHLDLRPDERGAALWDDLLVALKDKPRVFWVNVPGHSQDTRQWLATFLNRNGCLDDISDTSLPVKVYELRTPLIRPSVLPPSLAGLVPDTLDPVQVDFGALRVTGVKFDTQTCTHGQIALATRWQMAQPGGDPLKISLFLLDSQGRRIQSQDVYIDDPNQQHTNRWNPGVPVRGYYTLNVPFGTAPGNYTLAFGVYPSSNPQRLTVQSAQGVQATYSNYVALGKVAVYRTQDPTADPYNTHKDSTLLPANAELGDGLMLDGYDVNAAAILPGELLDVTARWRAVRDALPDYAVRVALRQGQDVIASDTGKPADGTYPTSQWQVGEVVTERRDVHIPASAKGGMARLEIGLDGGKMLYVADVHIATITHTFSIPTIDHPVQAMFAGIGDLIGYRLDSSQVSAQNPIKLDLYWRAGAAPSIDQDDVVFSQLLAADGHVVAQSDSMPAAGQRPTRTWLPGEIIVDHHELAFGDAVYAGNATLIVGIYNPETNKRVSISGSPNDYVTLPAKIGVTH